MTTKAKGKTVQEAGGVKCWNCGEATMVARTWPEGPGAQCSGCKALSARGARLPPQ